MCLVSFFLLLKWTVCRVRVRRFVRLIGLFLTWGACVLQTSISLVLGEVDSRFYDQRRYMPRPLRHWLSLLRSRRRSQSWTKSSVQRTVV